MVSTSVTASKTGSSSDFNHPNRNCAVVHERSRRDESGQQNHQGGCNASVLDTACLMEGNQHVPHNKPELHYPALPSTPVPECHCINHQQSHKHGGGRGGSRCETVLTTFLFC